MSPVPVKGSLVSFVSKSGLKSFGIITDEPYEGDDGTLNASITWADVGHRGSRWLRNDSSMIAVEVL